MKNSPPRKRIDAGINAPILPTAIALILLLSSPAIAAHPTSTHLKMTIYYFTNDYGQFVGRAEHWPDSQFSLGYGLQGLSTALKSDYPELKNEALDFKPILD